MNRDMMRRMRMRDNARRRMRFDMSTVENRTMPHTMYNHEQDYGYSDRAYPESDYAQYGERPMRDGHYVGNYSVPFEVAGRYGRQYHMPDYAMDYAEESTRLSEQELKKWAERLQQHIDMQYKTMYEKERVLKRANELGMLFEKFNKEEFYVTVLMLYTDFCKTLGSTNLDMYLKLAKDWLCDDDIAVKYSEKLAIYHDCIVQGE